MRHVRSLQTFIHWSCLPELLILTSFKHLQYSCGTRNIAHISMQLASKSLSFITGIIDVNSQSFLFFIWELNMSKIHRESVLTRTVEAGKYQSVSIHQSVCYVADLKYSPSLFYISFKSPSMIAF